MAKSIFFPGSKTSTHKVPILTSLLSSLHRKQKEHFVFIFDYVVKTNISPETNDSSETENFIYPQEQNQVKQQLCKS